MNLPRHFQVRVGFPLTITVKVTVILDPQRVVQYDCLCLLRCLGLEPGYPLSVTTNATIALRWHTFLHIISFIILYKCKFWIRINVLQGERREFVSTTNLHTTHDTDPSHTSIPDLYILSSHIISYRIWLYIRANVSLGIFIVATWL